MGRGCGGVSCGREDGTRHVSSVEPSWRSSPVGFEVRSGSWGGRGFMYYLSFQIRISQKIFGELKVYHLSDLFQGLPPFIIPCVVSPLN